MLGQEEFGSFMPVRVMFPSMLDKAAESPRTIRDHQRGQLESKEKPNVPAGVSVHLGTTLAFEHLSLSFQNINAKWGLHHLLKDMTSRKLKVVKVKYPISTR